MAPAGFVSLSNFNQIILQPREALSVYLHELKRLLNQAIPNLDAATQNQLLCHQFLIGISGKISRRLEAAGEIENIAKVLERAKLLMTQEVEEKVAVISPQATSLEVQELKGPNGQTDGASGSIGYSEGFWWSFTQPCHAPRGHQVCYFCQQPGHLKRNCPHRRPPPICYACGQKGHIARDWTAAGEPIPILGYVSAPEEVGQVGVEHPFVVVKSLIAGAILGIDFLRQHELVLDFTFSPIKVLSHN